MAKIKIASEQHFRCVSCGNCCRRWHVAVSTRDMRRLQKLSWGSEPDIPENPFTKIRGHDYVAHKQNGDCVYLNPETDRCRIHSKFGAAAKPIGCAGTLSMMEVIKNTGLMNFFVLFIGYI